MINPRGMTLRDWADSVILSSSDAWSLGRLDDESRWQDWAIGLLRTSPFTQQVVPDPYGFANWFDWAMRAYTMLETT